METLKRLFDWTHLEVLRQKVHDNVMEQLLEDQRCEICLHGFNQANKNLGNKGKKYFQTKEEIAKPDVIVY